MHSLLLQVGEDSTTTSSSGMSAGAAIVVGLVSVVVTVFYIVALWRVFTKAGEKGWKSLIPIWNLIVILRIAGRPWWWLFLFIIPLVNIVVAVIVYIDVAKAFGKSTAFGVGLALLGFIFLPILAFGSAEYQGSPRTL